MKCSRRRPSPTPCRGSYIGSVFFPPPITLWGFLSQVLNEDQSLQGAVARLIAFSLAKGQQPPSANTAAYSNARGRLPLEVPLGLARQTGQDLEAEVPEDWLWRGRHVKLMDGSTVSMPDTPENQAAYPQPRSQKAGVGFPIARLVAIISCSTGALLDLALGTYRGKGTGEHGLLRELMGNFQSGDVALGDAYYCSFFLIALLMRMGVDAVFPMHGARDCDFRRGIRLGKKDHLVDWLKPQRPQWMDQETYDSFPERIVVREAEVRVERDGFRPKPRILVTTLLNPRQVGKQDLAGLYDFRWLCEIDLRAIKATMRMDILRGKTPEMVRKEIWVHLLAYNLIRKVMVQAARRHHKKPRQLSFKLALQCIEAFRQSGLLASGNAHAYENLLLAIASKEVGNRPGRWEPRAVKRRPKPFPRLRQRRSRYHAERAAA